MDEQEETWYADDFDEGELLEDDEDDGDIDLSENYLDDLEAVDEDYNDNLSQNTLTTKSMSSEILSCSIPVIKQACWLLILVLASCLLWRVIRFLFSICFPSSGKICRTFVTIILHMSSIFLGLLVLYYASYDLWWIVIGLILSLTVLFTLNINSDTSKQNKNYTNWELFITLGICSSVQLYCEFYKNPVKWHQIRGSIMIIIMKCISFSMERKTFYEMINKEPCIHLWAPLHRGLLWLSYCLCPASLLFGPWFNPLRYEQIIRNYANDRPFSLKNTIISLFQTIKLFGLSLFYLSYSTCFTHTLLSILKFQPWLYAYFASQSFRFSHYFVCIASESFMTILGYCDKYPIKSSDKTETKEKGSVNNYVYKPLIVTRSLYIEFPRSLVEVVIYWNLPMHNWLKQYVYKPLRSFGHVYAILGTYTASSLLHGLNFQLSAVLFSIGIYAYIEYVFREKLAKILDACIASRPCPESCCHSNKNISWVYWCNVAFSCLAIFHLAYLAVMFDTSEQQFQGYNMWHTISKWYNLGFLSHIVAFGNFLFYIYL
uniref:Protein-serine O-palmitoleoyltransferase porcupine n=1 Tax=Schistosoma japonicum TaxID=6182 RepID=A0A219LX43_SCHJA|nr:porcupine [Schistosoma japonicum]